MKKKVEYDLSMTDGMTVREVERMCNEVEKNGIPDDAPDLKLKTSAVAMWRTIASLRFTEKGTSMKIGELREWASLIRSAFICIHRVNYSAFQAMNSLWYFYEEKRRVNPNAKRFWRKTEDIYMRYQREHSSTLERSAWMLLQDHRRLCDDMLEEPVSQLEHVISNVFIRQRNGKPPVGQLDDIELLAKASVPLLWTRVLRYSFTDFFSQYIEKCGIDFSCDFRYADLSAMSRNFCWMLQQMGIRLHDDANGDKVLDFFDLDNSSTIESAWNRVMSIARDDVLADKSAEKAIEKNSDAKEKYRAAMDDIERKAFDASLERLKQKVKVTSL